MSDTTRKEAKREKAPKALEEVRTVHLDSRQEVVQCLCNTSGGFYAILRLAKEDHNAFWMI